MVLALPAAAPARPADRDRDRLPDRWERFNRLSPTAKQTHRDPDRDGLDNLAEYRMRTKPRTADTDADRLKDGPEIDTAHDPRDRDSDDDEISDGDENAGTVETLAGDILTIRRADGSRLSGLITDETDLGCGKARELTEAHGDGVAEPDEETEGDDADFRPQPDDGSAGDEADAAGESEPDAGRASAECPSDALQPGARVHEAELELEPGGPVFVSVTLVRR